MRLAAGETLERPPGDQRLLLAALPAGAALGGLCALSPGPAVALLGLLLLLIRLDRLSRKWDDRPLFHLFLLGLGIRLALVLLLTLRIPLDGFGFGGQPVTMFGDSDMNLIVSQRAMLAYYGFHNYAGTHLQPGIYGYNFLTWVFGALYLLIGYSPFSALLINAVLSCLAAWLIYLASLRITGHRRVSRVVMALAILWPTQILWSVNLLKEPALLFVIALIVFLFVKMVQERKMRYLPLVLLPALPMGHLRTQTNLLMLLTICSSLILILPGKYLRRGALVALPLLLALGWAERAGLRERVWQVERQVIDTQIGFITTGGAWYRFIPERYGANSGYQGHLSAGEAGTGFLKALYYYLFTPNPFQDFGLNKLAAFPQMLLWYPLLLIGFPLGTLYLWRYRRRDSLIIFVYLALFTTAMALFTGSVGTAIRHRDILTPYFLIPAVVGLFNLRGWVESRLSAGGSAGAGRGTTEIR